MSRSPPMVVVKVEPLDDIYFSEVQVKDESNTDHFSYDAPKDYDSESSTNLNIKEQKRIVVKDELPVEREYNICRYCERVFYTEQDLSAHLTEKHNPDEPFNCEFCDRRFASGEYLELHCMIHEGQQYRCDVCGKKFATMKYRSEHMKTHISQPDVSKAEPTNIANITCQYCDSFFTSDHALACHISEAHDPYKPYNCDICVRKFTSKGRLSQHLVGTHGAQKTYITRDERNKMKRTVLTKEPSEYNNSESREAIHKKLIPRGGQRTTRSRATERENAECDKKKQQLQCDMCKKWFARKISLRGHIINHEMRYECGICKRKFKRYVALSKHIKMHPTKFECEICGEKFRLKKRLDKHAITHLPEGMRHMCNVCYSKFPTKYLLDTHIAMHEKCEIEGSFDPTKLLTRLEDHPTDDASISKQSENQDTQVQPSPTEHVCQVCKETLATSADFDKHMISHRKMTQFTCGICKKSFKLSYYLKIHTRIHTGDKPYECGICDKKFVTAGKLTRHTKTHAGQTHYPCGKCSKRFLLQMDLKTHMQAHGKRNAIVESLLDVWYLKKI